MFSDPTSYLFWSTAIKRVILSGIISSGLLIASSKFGQKYKLVSTPLILISLLGALFIAPERLYWASWVILILIHGLAIINLFKPIVMPLSSSNRRCWSPAEYLEKPVFQKLDKFVTHVVKPATLRQ